VRDVMRPGVIAIDEDASIEQAQRTLLAHRVHAILVVEHGGRPLGWATSRDLLSWCNRDVALHAARDAVGEAAVAVEPSATAREGLAVLLCTGASRLLVARTADGLPEGVVADLDLLAVLA
jgi:CBS-domain-containing membrane protein